MPQYGEHYARYGAGECSLCKKHHDGSAVVEESAKSRFKLLQFAAELATINKDKDTSLSTQRKQKYASELKRNEDKTKARREVILATLKKPPYRVGPVPSAEHGINISVTSDFNETRFWDPTTNELEQRKSPLQQLAEIQEKIGAPDRHDWRAMLGLLITPNATYVTAAGTFENKTGGLFAYVATKKGYKTCGKNDKGDTPSISNVRITKLQYESCKSPNSQVPGSCAAPKLIQQYIADARQNRWAIQVSQLHMSEIYFVPNTETRRNMMDANQSGGSGNANGLYWTPGLTAHSCETCERLVPLLLCPAGPGF